MANELTFTQSATILNSLLEQAQGRASITAVNETQFVAQAQIALQIGYEGIMNSLSQVLSRTIFSIRPYNRKLKGLYADAIRYGNHVRKISAIDGEFEEDDRSKLQDGYSIDPWVVNKPKALQMNWYGENVYQVSKTFFKDQLDTAFSSSSEFGSFVSMVLQNISDMIEQKHEVTARGTLANLIAGKSVADSDNVYYLISEYKTEKGITDADFNYRSPENFPDFARWLYSFIETLSDKLTERGVMYHMNVTNKEINRHTPKEEQVMYLYGPLMNSIKNEVKSVTFNEELLKMIDFEKVNYWQSPADPEKVIVTPNYINSSGELVEAEESVTVDNIFGVLFDRECAGYTVVNTWSQSTPMNARGGYTNTFWHFTDRPWLDLTENAIVLILDENPLLSLSLDAESGEAEVLGKTVSDLQEDITISDGKITGKLKYTTGYTGFSGDPSLQSGYYLVLSWADAVITNMTSIKIGLDPTAGSGLVECISDPDKNIVLRISNKNTQKLKVLTSNSDLSQLKTYDLSGLELVE